MRPVGVCGIGKPADVCGLIALVFLANNLATASFLTAEEQEFALKRLSGEIQVGNERFK